MADNLSIESPDFDAIKDGDDHATEDAIRLMWYVMNYEIKTRRQADRRIEERLSPKVLGLAPGAALNNVDTQGAGIIMFTGSTAVDVSGYRAREDGDILFIHVTGSGTITHLNQDSASDAGNRMVFRTGANSAVATNRSLFLTYLNSRWREMSWA